MQIHGINRKFMGVTRSSRLARNKARLSKGSDGFCQASQVAQQKELLPDIAEVMGSDPGSDREKQ